MMNVILRTVATVALSFLFLRAPYGWERIAATFGVPFIGSGGVVGVLAILQILRRAGRVHHRRRRWL